MVPGVQVFPVVPPALPGGGDFGLQFIIASTADTSEILSIAQQLQLRAIESGYFAFPPMIDVKVDQPQSEVVLDRDKVAALGLSMEDVANDLSSMMGGGYVNRFNIDGRSYKVIPQIRRIDRLNPDQLAAVHVTGPDGELVPLDAIAEVVDSTVPRSLNRMQQLNAVKLSGVPIRPLDEVLRFMEDEAARIMPSGYVIDYTGQSRQLREEGDRFLPALGLAVVLIFLVLAAQFESLRDPAVILITVPLAVLGALASLWYFNQTMNIFSKIGIIMLIGLVAKNAILVVDFTNQLKAAGLEVKKALIDATQVRIRPILMTTLAMVFGMLPIALASGAGAEWKNGLAWVIIGGLISSLFLTLVIVPVVYSVFDGITRRFSRKKEKTDYSTEMTADYEHIEIKEEFEK